MSCKTQSEICGENARFNNPECFPDGGPSGGGLKYINLPVIGSDNELEIKMKCGGYQTRVLFVPADGEPEYGFVIQKVAFNITGSVPEYFDLNILGVFDDGNDFCAEMVNHNIVFWEMFPVHNRYLEPIDINSAKQVHSDEQLFSVTTYAKFFTSEDVREFYDVNEFTPFDDLIKVMGFCEKHVPDPHASDWRRKIIPDNQRFCPSFAIIDREIEFFDPYLSDENLGYMIAKELPVSIEEPTIWTSSSNSALVREWSIKTINCCDSTDEDIDSTILLKVPRLVGND